MSTPPFPSVTKTWHNASYPAIDPSRLELSVTNKTVLVTGGGIGIGASITYAFAKAGASKLAIIGRTESALQATKAKIEKDFPGRIVTYAVADIVNPTDVNKAFQKIVSQIGQIDIGIHNAAYMPALVQLREADASDWWQGYEVNVRGSFNVISAFLKSSSAHPTLVNVTTGAALLPPTPTFSSYATSKITGVNLFEYVAAENPNIHVVSVHPGGVMTRMGEKAKEAGFNIPLDDGKFSSSPSVRMVR
jgi:NAD(P)-dependent dehydrogenase (short-subunit alcohol dehydrogenase family)